jgi:hypothetical protein
VNASQENWVELNETSLPDADLNGAGLAYDVDENETVLYGACPTYGASPCNETWVFRDGLWSELHPLVSPPPLEHVGMAYDPQSWSVVMFGGGGPSTGLSNETWEFSAANWSELNTTVAPPAGGGVMVYDAAADGLLLFAGSGPNATNGTWIFQNGTWTELSVSVEPPGATGMTYDPILRAAITYGGGGGPRGNYTWLFRNGSWENVTPVGSPPAQYDASLSYDLLSQSVILFGGFSLGQLQLLNQTWAFNGSSWVELSPGKAPSARSEAAMAYDGGDGLTLLVGGGSSDSWAFGAGRVSFVSVPGPGGSTRMGSTLHANGTATWFPFNSYSLRALPNPGYSGEGLNVSGSLVSLNGSYLLVGNATVQADFLAFPTVTLESFPSECDLVFNGTQYANGSSPSFAAPGAFSLSTTSCNTVQFGFWSARGNATIENATSSATRVTLTGPAIVVAHFLANLEFYAGPAGAGGIVVNGTRVPVNTPTLYQVASYAILTLAAPGWRLESLTTSGNGLSIANGLLSVESSGGVRATFAAYPNVVIETSDPACGPVSFDAISEPNGSLVGTNLGSFAVEAPDCADAEFVEWQTSGGLNVSAPTQSNTTVTVTGNGTLDAVLARAAWITVQASPSDDVGYIEWNGSRFDSGVPVRQLWVIT